MEISHLSARPLLILAVLATLVATGCDKDTPTPGPNGTAQGSPATATTAPPSASTGNATDYCTVAERISTESGVMVNKHFIPLPEETLDMFKSVVNLSLAAKDQLVATVPASVRSAMLIVLQYFQALKDSNFSAAPPPDFTDANKTVNDYGVSACGFVFDQ